MDTRRCLEILELESVSSPEELKQAYRDMVQIWHPDRYHGNSRLEKIAGQKLKEINQAYRHLQAYFDPEQIKKLKNSGAFARVQPSRCDETDNSAYPYGKQTGTWSSTKDDAGQGGPEPDSHVKVYPAKKKLSFGKYIVLLALGLFMVSSGLIVYFVLNMDRLTSRSIGAASEALKTIKFKLEKDVASQMETGRDEHKDSPSTDDEKSNLMKEKEPAETKKYFEIHLKGGTIIMTDSWWQQDNMIMYKQFGGSMGIEKSRIVRIVERQATRSDPSARF